MLRARLDDASSERDALELFPEWREPVTSRRFLRAGLGSILIHAAIFAILLTLPETTARYDTHSLTADFHRAVPLYAPKIFKITQREENKGKVTQQLDIRSSLREAPPKTRAFVPPAPAGPVAPPAALTPPPQIQAAVSVPPLPVVPTLPQPVERPKVVLENVAPAAAPAAPSENPIIKLPGTALDELDRVAVQPGGAGGVVVSPEGASDATALRQMQLLSDPLGVDFKPYMLQVLAKVRRNWMSIAPDSARGRRGLVIIQFSVDRRGAVPKLVIASTSGIAAFDRAAVAGISASDPFPPLPAAFKGDQIKLQMVFSYNLPPKP